MNNEFENKGNYAKILELGKKAFVTKIGVAILCASGYCLFAIKSEVRDLSYQLSETVKQINEEKNSINILKAEYAYLQSPGRIAKLVDKYLNLTSIKTEQMTKDPLKDDEESKEQKDIVSVSEKITTPTPKPKKVVWRYKRPKSHVTEISHKR
ncbi:MAG: hypothetical protein KA998_02130 [Rickettsiaceae bacterium]|nr:hypothetical protein [Rickettsiaceae bacterium]